VPAFPNNVVVFPDRDFVTIEGYQDHIGETATVTVTRGTTVIGSAKGVVAEGDVAFEINHPGGVCWGAGTTLKVTPDIRPDDKVSINFDAAPVTDPDTTTTASGMVTTDTVLTGSTLVVTGTIAGDVNTAQTEQRIVNPDLTGTDVARRDVRAVPGPLTPAAKGGYSSMLEFPTPTTFKATYEFTTAATAQIAATGGGERFMSWQAEDGDANRQGLTIAEYGELGGPGMGGCPAGPADQGAPSGSAQVIRSADGTSAQVTWTPATAVPDATAVTGYSVLAIAPGTGPQTQIGTRIMDPNAKQATISGLTSGVNYAFEVRSLAGARMSDSFASGAAAGGTQTPTAPATLTVTPALNGGGATDTPVTASSVTASTDAGGQIWYSTTGPAYTDGSLASDVTLYTAPIPITGTTPVTLHFAAFSQDGNVKTGVGSFIAGTTQPAPSAPNAAPTVSNVGQDRVTLTWPAVTGAAGYQVEVAPAVTPAPVATTATTQPITGLAPNTTYTFTVKAKNAEGTFGPASAAATQRTSVGTDRVTVTSGRYRAADRLEMDGTISALGTTVTIRETSSPTSRLLATATVSAPVAPATVPTWTVRLRNGATPANVPAQVFAHSTGGGVSAAFTLAR
jgi:hypothetical protein